MRGERERHAIPTDVDVGVMPLLLRGAGDRVDELHRRHEVRELEDPPDDGAAALPTGNGGLGGTNLSGIEFRHGATFQHPIPWRPQAFFKANSAAVQQRGRQPRRED